ncbi:MAG TPA: 3-oxoadipate enol-lactonase [Streptosporangiaceae bacterium]|nr:3-oxoadipate enol-lactonase [Streptosporangiaceae bacterium]
MSETRLTLTASLEGSGPVLVLGNSLGTSRSVWDPQLPALAGRFRLLRYELPGHGTGPHHPEPGPYTIAELGSAVLALLGRHGIDRASYAGISIGGMIGLWLAANAPSRITALAVCCTSAHLPPAGDWLARAGLVRSEGMAPVIGPALGRWFTPPFIRSAPPAVAAVKAMLEGTGPEGYAGCCEAIAAMDLRPALGSITAPTLVVAGSEDPSTPPWHGALIARRVPGAKLVVVRGAAHLANIQAPGPVTAALLAHLTT